MDGLRKTIFILLVDILAPFDAHFYVCVCLCVYYVLHIFIHALFKLSEQQKGCSCGTTNYSLYCLQEGLDGEEKKNLHVVRAER